MIILPTAIFYIILFASGSSMESARRSGWLFPESDSSYFWAHWELGFGAFGSGLVAWDQLPSILPVLVVMLPIVSLDVRAHIEPKSSPCIFRSAPGRTTQLETFTKLSTLP